MIITETTPKPVQRTFSIELTENQLMNLGLELGTIIPNDIERLVRNKEWPVMVFPGIVYERLDLYDAILDILKKNRQLNQSYKKVDLIF